MTIEQELRELDAWIAEHVMGTKNMFGLKKRGFWYRPNAHGYTDRQSEAWQLPFEEAKKHEYPHGGHDDRVTVCEIEIPSYTSNPAAAMQVLEKCAEKTTVALNQGTTGWFISDCDKKLRFAVAETLPLAICLFAKKLFSK